MRSACSPDVRQADHASFWDRGYNSMLVEDSAYLRNPNYHEPTDTPDTLDYAFLRSVTQAVLATAVEVVTAPAACRRALPGKRESRPRVRVRSSPSRGCG